MSALDTASTISHFVANMSNKKSLKAISAMVAQAAEVQGDLFEHRMVFAVSDAVDWDAVFAGNVAKDANKLQFLAKTVKALAARHNFLDFFGEALAEAANRRVWLEQHRELLRALKLAAAAELMLAAALALARDAQISALGCEQLRQAVGEAFKARAVPELPASCLHAVAELVKARLGWDSRLAREVAFFVEATVGQDPYCAPLLACGEPRVRPAEARATEVRGEADVPLHALLRESGPLPAAVLRQLLRERAALREADVLKCLLLIIESGRAPRTAPAAVAAAHALLYEEAGGARGPTAWDTDLFVRAVADCGKRLDFEQVVAALAQLPDECAPFFEGRQNAQALFAAFAALRRLVSFRWPAEAVQGRWRSPLAKGLLLLAILESAEPEVFCLGELFPGRVAPAEGGAGPGAGLLAELGGGWLHRGLVAQVIELTEHAQISQHLRVLLDPLLKNCVEALFHVLVAAQPRRALAFYRELLKTCLAIIFNSSIATLGVIEAFYAQNKRLFVAVMAELAEGDGALLFLSKLLDFSQTTKNFQSFFLSLTHSENHYFSISLALLAVKREFLRLENWMDASVKGGQLAWVEEFLRYLNRHVLQPLAEPGARRRPEELLEKAQLSVNNLAVIFENYLLSAAACPFLLPAHLERVRAVHDALAAQLPELSQAAVKQPDARANEILEKLYFEAYPLDDFIETVTRLRHSPKNRDQEILSCILIHIMNEYRYFKHFPEKELQITADIYGRLVKHRIVDGRTLLIFLKGLTDCLELEGNMFSFGLRGIAHFILDTDLNLAPEVYRQLFANARLRDQHADLLYDLSVRLQAAGRLELIPPEHVRAVAKSRRARPPRGEEEAPARDARPAERTLMEHLGRLYQEGVQGDGATDADMDALVFFLNALDPARPEAKLAAFDQLLASRNLAARFSKYLVFRRAPSEAAHQAGYARLAFRSAVKGLFARVYRDSMAMLNAVVDFINAKELLHNEEKNCMKLCGKWGGAVTFALNQPVQLRHLNLRQKVLEAVERKKLYNIVLFMCSLLSAIEDSEIFTPRVPCINALFDVLREIYPLPFLPQTARVFIEVLNNDLKVKSSDIHEFRWLAARRAAESRARRLGPADAAALIKLDLGKLPERELADKFHVDLRQIVSAAVETSLFEVRGAIIGRTLKNTLETVKVLVVKDFCVESDEAKLLAAAQAMVTNLTWNLALFTCREPVRVKMLEKLDNLLRVQSELDEPARKALKESLAAANLDFALVCLKRVVVEASLQEVAKDADILEELRRRRQAREGRARFVHEGFQRLQRELPKLLKPKMDAGELDAVEIYNCSVGGEIEAAAPRGEPAEPPASLAADEERIGELAREVESELQGLSREDQLKFMAKLLASLTQMLQQSKNNEGTAVKIAQVFFRLLLSRYQKLTVDILLACQRFHPQLPRHITAWVFESEALYDAELLATLLRKSLLVYREFDARLAAALAADNPRALNCAAEVFAHVVGGERLFSASSFPAVMRRLAELAQGPALDALSGDAAQFVRAVAAHGPEAPGLGALRLRAATEAKHARLAAHVAEFFTARNDRVYFAAVAFADAWAAAADEAEARRLVAALLKDELFAQGPALRLLVAYLVDMAVNSSRRAPAPAQLFAPDYAALDAVLRFLRVLAEWCCEGAPANYFLETAVVCIMAALAKAHDRLAEAPFDARPFFRLLRGLLAQTDGAAAFNRKAVFAEALQLLCPTRYPRFAFAWLGLVSARPLVALLGSGQPEHANEYLPLLLQLFGFFREALTPELLGRQEARLFYIGSLRYLLVLQNDHPEFLSQHAFALLEELPERFRQLRNIVLAAYPRDLRLPNPFLPQSPAVAPPEYKRLPPLHPRAEFRVNAHGLIDPLTAYIKSKSSTDVRDIAAEFYAPAGGGRPELLVPLVRGFVFFAPQLVARFQHAQSHAFYSYRGHSYSLLVKLLKLQLAELNEELVRAMLDNLTYPNPITFYFAQLLLFVVNQLNEDRLTEQVLRQVFERLIVAKPHPWGLLHFLNNVIVTSLQALRLRPFYKETDRLLDELIALAGNYVQIKNLGDWLAPEAKP